VCSALRHPSAMSASRNTRSRNQDVVLLVGHDDDDGVAPVPAKCTCSSPCDWGCCLDIDKLPPHLLCAGCCNVENSLSNKPRSEHKSSKHQCFKGWTQDSTKVSASMRRHVEVIKQWIVDNDNVDCDAAFEAPTMKKGCPSMNPRVLLQTPPPTNVIKSKSVTQTKEFKRPLNFQTQEINCNGRTLVCKMPTTHELTISNKLRKLENRSEILKAVRGRVQSCSYTPGSVMSQALLAIAMASVPTLAFSAAQCLFPMFLHAFFYDTGLFKPNLFKKQFDINCFVTVFPSDWTFRKLSMH